MYHFFRKEKKPESFPEVTAQHSEEDEQFLWQELGGNCCCLAFSFAWRRSLLMLVRH